MNLLSKSNYFKFRLVPKYRYLHHSQRNHTNSSEHYDYRKVSALSPALLLLGFMPIFTFALGTWQVQRLKWKVNLIDELSEKLQRPPISLPGHINISTLSDIMYRKVLLRGRWDHAHTVFVGPRVRDGVQGFHVITPLLRTDGSTLLVDRGFVSSEFGKLSSLNEQHGSTANEEATVIGILRSSQQRNAFTPDNKPEQGEWYWADVDALVEHAGGESADVQPVFVEQIFDGHYGEAQSKLLRGEPIGRAAAVDLRNAHLSYAITWYSLSVFTTAMFLHLLRRRRISRGKRLPR